MKIVLDKESNMLNIQFSEKPSTESAELEQGLVVDYDKDGQIVNIEIENANNFDFSKFTFETLNQKSS